MFSFPGVNLSRFVPFLVMLQRPSLHLRICQGLVMLWAAKLFAMLNLVLWRSEICTTFFDILGDLVYQLLCCAY